MHCLARTLFANRSSEGEAQALSASQLYDGLKIKARDPGEFIEVIEDCKVISESKTGLLREVKFKGNPERVQERVQFFEPMTVDFTMLSSEGETIARITNIISTMPDGEVLLTFTFAIGRNEDEGDVGLDADLFFSQANKGMMQTLKTIRKLVREGKV